MADAHSMNAPTDAAGTASHGHSSWQTYVLIGVILTVITAVEVAVFYLEALHAVLVPILLVLSAAKFVIVVLWYMHLKSDSRIYWRVFFGPLFLAMLVVAGMIIIFKVLPK